MSVEKAFEINQQSLETKKEMTEELKGLQNDIVELNQVLGLFTKRGYTIGN